MIKRDFRVMLALAVLVAGFLPCPSPAFLLPVLLLLTMRVETRMSDYFVLASMDDIVFLLSATLPGIVYLHAMPILVVLNLCLAGFAHPWLRKLYRAVLLVLWISFLILLPRGSIQMYIIPLTLTAVTITEFMFVRKGYIARWDSEPGAAPDRKTPDGDNRAGRDAYRSMK